MFFPDLTWQVTITALGIIHLLKVPKGQELASTTFQQSVAFFIQPHSISPARPDHRLCFVYPVGFGFVNYVSWFGEGEQGWPFPLPPMHIARQSYAKPQPAFTPASPLPQNLVPGQDLL